MARNVATPAPKVARRTVRAVAVPWRRDAAQRWAQIVVSSTRTRGSTRSRATAMASRESSWVGLPPRARPKPGDRGRARQAEDAGSLRHPAGGLGIGRPPRQAADDLGRLSRPPPGRRGPRPPGRRTRSRRSTPRTTPRPPRRPARLAAGRTPPRLGPSPRRRATRRRTSPRPPTGRACRRGPCRWPARRAPRPAHPDAVVAQVGEAQRGEVGRDVGVQVGRGIVHLVEELLADGVEGDQPPAASGLVITAVPSASTSPIGKPMRSGSGFSHHVPE